MKYIEIDFLISFSSRETRQVIVIKGTALFNTRLKYSLCPPGGGIEKGGWCIFTKPCLTSLRTLKIVTGF